MSEVHYCVAFYYFRTNCPSKTNVISWTEHKCYQMKSNIYENAGDMVQALKQLSFRCSKYKKMKKKNNGKNWSSCVQWRNLLLLTTNSVDQIVGKISFFFALSTINAVTVMYSRNILMTEERIVCFQSTKVKICRLFFPNNYYIYIWRDFLKYL